MPELVLLKVPVLGWHCLLGYQVLQRFLCQFYPDSMSLTVGQVLY